MVNPSGNSETVRCGMCGKPNLAENAVCAYCGARLRPMTAEEMGLSSSGSPASEEPQRPESGPEEEDPLAGLRQEYHEHDDETIIGPSASQDRIRRQSLYEDIEPDFTIGQGPADSSEDEGAGEFGSIPDWLREASKPPKDTGSLQPPGSNIPEWLIDESPPSAPPSPLAADEVELPDWLGQPRSDTEIASPADTSLEGASPSGAMPDWLRDLDSSESESEAEQPLFEVPDWLSEQAQPASSMPEPSEETPAWLLPTADKEEEEPTFEIPDWLGEAAVSEQPSQEAELRAEQPLGTEAPEPDEQVEPPATGIPDWLREAAEIPAQSAGEPVVEPSFSEEPPEPSEEQPATGIPEWLLSEAGLQQQAESGQEPAPSVEEPEVEQTGEEEPEPLVTSGMPDWLVNIATGPLTERPEASEPPAPMEETLDWLRPPEIDEEPESAEAATLDWLRAPGEAVEGAPETSAEEQAQMGEVPDVPDWLRPPAEDRPDAEALPLTEPEDLPGWMSGLGLGAVPVEEAPAEAPPPEQPTAEIGVPDWLAELGGTSAPEAAEAPVEPSIPTSEAPAEPAPEVPDWLTGLSGEPALPAAQAEEPVSTPEPEVPDWLTGLSGEPALPAAQAEEPVSAPEPEVPDWLAGLGGEPSAPTTAPEPVQPAAEVESESPDWLAGIGSEPAAPAPTPEPFGPAETGGPDVPEWLAGIGEVPTGPGVEKSAEPALSDESPDWLADLDQVFGAPVGEAPLTTPPVSDDLLDLSTPLPAILEPEEEEIDLAEAGNLPEWLRAAAPEAPGAAPIRPLDAPGDLPPELAGLRFEAITGQSGAEAITEKVGALKDVTGVLRPEILFAGESLHVGDLVDQLVVTDDQRRRIETLQHLLVREAEGVVIAERESVIPVLRWVVALILLAAIAAGLFTASQGASPLPPPAPSAGVSDVHSLIAQLPSGSTVIVAFEYEADSRAEMQPLAVALLNQIAGRGATVYTISTRPTGPAMAEAAIASVETRIPAPWANLGYISGGSRGVSALAIGGLPGMGSPLTYDYRGEETGLAASRLSDLNPALIVVLTSRWEDLRIWVEQADPYTDAPMVAAMSASSAPMAYPYEQSGQLAGVLNGINDAAAYRALSNAAPAPLLAAVWNGQAFGGLIAAVMIVVGGLAYGFSAWQQQQEQE